MKKVVHKFVLVEWYDASSASRWSDPEALKGASQGGLAKIVTVGILFSRDKLSTRVALNMDVSNEAYADIISIPSKQVLKFRIIGRVSLPAEE